MTIDKPSPMLRQLHIDQFARPFRFVKWLSFAIVIAGLQIFSGFIEDALTGKFVDTLYQLPLMLALGFTAWVCWRNIDGISAVIDPLMRIAYLVLGTFCLIFLLAFGITIMTSGFGDTSLSSDGVFIMCLLWGTMTLLASGSLKRLRRKKIDNIGITLGELMRSTQPTSAEGTRWFTARNLKSPGLILFVGIGVILLLLSAGINGYLNSMFEGLTFNQNAQLGSAPRFLSQASQWAFFAACYFFLRARTKLQPTAQSVLSMDRRTPVLFLRSFVDDERVRFLYAQNTLFDFSLEARLATHFFRTGPFIAVDSPNHTPAIGAARASLTNEEWQGTVVKWMHAARLIVLLAGLTHWIRWEMRQILELGHGRKLIILMPELSGWKHRKRRLRADIAGKRFEAIRETFRGSPWEAGINEPCVPEKIRSLMFGPDGQVTAVCAKSRSRDCYQLAALISEYLICKEQKNEVRETRPQENIVSLIPAFLPV